MEQAVICNYIGKKGGGPLYAYEMTRGLVQNGVRVIAIIPDNIENLALWNTLTGCQLIKIKGYKDNYLSLLCAILRMLFVERRRIKKACKGIDISCVYVPMIQPFSLMVNSCFKKKRSIVTLHDPIPHKGAGRVYAAICEKTAMKADDVVVLSEKFVDFTAEHYGHDKKRVHVIPHGIFDNYKNVYDSSLRHTYDKEKINFLFFGRITPYKGLDVLAEAFRKLENEFENVALTIVGNGDFEPYRECYADIRNVTVINRWIKDEEVYGFYDNSSVITVLPYIEATQSGVIPVAMACGSMVVCTDCGGLSEQVEHGKTGILVPAGDADALYEAMKGIVEGGTDQQIVANAKEHIEGLSWDKLALQLQNIVGK
ncbi:MAG: glycosyltransferase family 4 protein [Ruminococcaceae bacterium]|nr:glycosyltransferase family 4 protein [Oscillospiraceae bacterium]